jgi:hypothetical protein
MEWEQKEITIKTNRHKANDTSKAMKLFTSEYIPNYRSEGPRALKSIS